MKIDSKRFYTVKEVVVKNGGILPVSESAIYASIASGEIPAKKIGSRHLIPGKFLLKLLDDVSETQC